MALRYARSLQVLVRTAIMWSVDHRAVGAPLQQSFDTLIPLLKQTGQFTLGFVDQRIMLNKILTTDGGLSQLENEFLKRGIGAVTFEAGITLARYKRAIAVLVTPAKLIDRQGGARPFLEQNPLENVHVIPASKNQARTEDGDVALDSDSESYLRSKQLERSGMGGAGIGLGDLELLLRDLGAVGERGEAVPRVILKAAQTAKEPVQTSGSFAALRRLRMTPSLSSASNEPTSSPRVSTRFRALSLSLRPATSSTEYPLGAGCG